MSLISRPVMDARRFDRLITIEWLMKILWELYGFEDRRLQAVTKRCEVLESMEWEEVKKNPVQAVSVLMAVMKLLAKNDPMFGEMVDTYISCGIWDAFVKADPYFEYLNRVYGKSVFLQEVNLV